MLEGAIIIIAMQFIVILMTIQMQAADAVVTTAFGAADAVVTTEVQYEFTYRTYCLLRDVDHYSIWFVNRIISNFSIIRSLI